MSKIISFDLGTNSIGWAIRDTDEIDNQIIDYGVTIFKKGVGEGKSGEYSLAAARRTQRSKRRLYNAKRYRKWATLKILSENNMCPLSTEELRLWSIGNWEIVNGKAINKGRVYPKSTAFHAWLAMDFAAISEDINITKFKPAFKSPYSLRSSLLDLSVINDDLRLLKIGRAFYHLAQRRGFKTSRKNGKSIYGNNDYLDDALKNNPDWKVSRILENGLIIDNRRIRNSGVIQRSYYIDEFKAICEKQNICKELADKIFHAIYYVRPLRSQKAHVGKCILEKNKIRIPVSHPTYEIFRALQFINNIKWRKTGSRTSFENIPIELKRNILNKVFFKKIERGERKGKINDRGYFEFAEIVNLFSENYMYEFNYAQYINENYELKGNPNVSCCPVIAGLMNVFSDSWQEPFIEENNKYGISFDNLKLTYKVHYDQNEKEKTLDFVGIWHLLFDFTQTRDNEEELRHFCKNVLKWDASKIDDFVDISISQGYGSLSFNAIQKINPFLENGLVYSEAVIFANLKTVLKKSNFNDSIDEIKHNIKQVILKTNEKKEKLNLTNRLIRNYLANNPINRAKGVDYRIKEIAIQEVEDLLKNHFGNNEDQGKSEILRPKYFDFILDKYLCFLNGEQKKEEKASSSQNKSSLIDYYRLPKLDEEIKSYLKENCNAVETSLKKLYHSSEIDIYPFSKSGFLDNPNPPTKGWKNPMAMRTLHELRNLINYLLQQNKIDQDTKVILEMARELNDANKRWAIQTYQKDREEENKEFAKAILGVAKEKYPGLNENDAENIDKVRLWWEQLENGDDIYKQIKALKEDILKYRLWKEQECICMYTGKLISLVNLFDGTKTHFEHTLYLSKSFDNSLANLTVCDANYNMRIKKNQIPTELFNYSEDWNSFTAIKPRLKPWINKVKNLKERIEINKFETKKAISKGDLERKNELIRRRHLLQFDFDYWNKKVNTFLINEIPNSWKNSQLIDTQIISKYARAYLKTVFSKVDVQNGITTSIFRKIYGLMGDEKKDRSNHAHHAVDAAVLTLIPSSAKREEILKTYYESIENKTKNKIFPIKPFGYNHFNIKHILSIRDNILIYHKSKDQTLNQTRKKIRKGGKVQYFQNENGELKPRFLEGNAIRGQLHLESFYGLIKPNERNDSGFVIKSNGEYKTKKNNNIEELWIVMRKPIDKIDFKKDVIVDDVLKNHLVKQLEEGKKIEELIDFSGNKIRHIRCRVAAGRGFLSFEKAIPIKSHVFISKHEHKREYLVQNADNYLYLLYEGYNESGKLLRGYKILNRMDIVQNNIKHLNELKSNTNYNKIIKIKGKNTTTLNLKAIIKSGDKVLLFKEHKDELNVENFNSRLYTVFKFNEPAPNVGYLYLQHHLEARTNDELSKLEEKDFIPGKFQPRIFLTPDKLNCLIENIDFIISPDGSIKLNDH